MPVGCWTCDYLERKGYEHIGVGGLGSHKKEVDGDDDHWQTSYTRCTAMMEWEVQYNVRFSNAHFYYYDGM